MKPRNKLERRYVALAERLPDISGKLIDWAKNHLFEDSRVGYLYRKTATVWCMCCGHVGRSSGCDLADALVYECPSCGKILSVYKSHARQQMNEKKWFYVIDVFEGNQVIRMMQASRSNEEQGVQTLYGVMEIFQKWLDSFIKEHPDMSEKYPGDDLFRWHNILTGSCEMGRRQFCKDRGIDPETSAYTVEEFIRLTCNSYGKDVIRQLADRLSIKI